MHRWGGLLAAVLATSIAGPALAGPPYVTDDPEPTDVGHWEIYNFVTATHIPGETDGQAGFDINYGPVKDVQLTAVIPADFENTNRAGLGDIELAVKYKIIHQDENSWVPDVAVFPRLFVPAADPRFGSGRAGFFLPVWAEKDFGKWSLFGGGGYDINPGGQNRDFWLSGLALTRAITDRFSLGVESFHQTPDERGAKAFTGVSLGATYKLNEHWTLMGSGGPGVENVGRQGQYEAYFALEATY